MAGAGKAEIPHTEHRFSHARRVPLPSSLDKKLAAFLKKQRGEMTFAQFSRLTGLPRSTLFRLENCEQSITLGRLNQILDRLKCDVVDVFGGRK